MTFNDSGLATGFTYYYRVRAYNAAGISLASSEISVTLSCLHCVTTAGFCDDQPHGTACGQQACGGVCRICGGSYDCFKP